jgi:hypothetical protein
MVGVEPTIEPEAPHTYRAAGLTIGAHCRLYGFASVSAAQPDLRVLPGRPHWADHSREVHYISSTHIDGVPGVIVERGDPGYSFRYADGTEFWLDAGGTRVWMHVATTLEDACTYLVGIVLSFAFRLRGDFSLHASAIQTDRGAIALVGPHGAGKSTLAAAFGRRGMPVLTDDILRLTCTNGTWTAHAFGGVIRLWEDGESLVFGVPGRLAPLTPTWPKRGLPIGSHGVSLSADSQPLAGIVFLKTTDDDAPPQLRSITAAQMALGLIGNSSASVLLNPEQRAAEFGQVASMTHLPCVEVERSHSRDSLSEVLTLLDAWMQSLSIGHQ